MDLKQLEQVEFDALAAVEAAGGEEELRELEVRFLGKKGSITALTRSISEQPKDQRGAFGKATNILKRAISDAIEVRRSALVEGGVSAELDDMNFDVTLPGTSAGTGSMHPLTQVQEQVEEIFSAMGFYVLDYPEVEDDFHNFEALNIPSDHPARDMQDTFWLKSGHLLRTHTSPGQIRAMGEFKPPFRAIFPGKVFRYEAVDASHEHTFHQVEGLMIDREVSVAHLISSMTIMLSQIFGREVTVRLRPGYFPFVEPGFELDMSCQICSGSGCKVCKQSGWLEFLGCGLVHPNVLRHAGLDPNEWQAWAFGMGLSRLVMMQYEIDDIRHIMGGDIRFLRQFV
ncbi:MAG TPA: phenylalanine--tRNA ligase subunit alpha [Myxococcales bacterium]|nr:phenylalanine--tRNA ligase subunit alpha [Myxococcales bacterium]